MKKHQASRKFELVVVLILIHGKLHAPAPSCTKERGRCDLSDEKKEAKRFVMGKKRGKAGRSKVPYAVFTVHTRVTPSLALTSSNPAEW